MFMKSAVYVVSKIFSFAFTETFDVLYCYTVIGITTVSV